MATRYVRAWARLKMRIRRATALGVYAGIVLCPLMSLSEVKGQLRETDMPPSYLTLDAVAQNGYETNYQEIASLYGGPMSKHPVISFKAHPEVLWVRPDMGIGMIANPLAFGIGAKPKAVAWQVVERSLEKGYLPIVTSRLREEGLLYEQLAYTTLLDARVVKTGHEKQVAMVRMRVINTNPTERQRATLWAFIPAVVKVKGIPLPEYNTGEPFEVIGSLPEVPDKTLATADDVLRDGPVLLGVHKEGPGIQTTRYDKVLKYEMDLLPGQRKSVWIKISSNKKGFSPADLDRVRAMDFQSTLDQVELDMEAILAKGTKIQVPEEIVNRIYKAQILYNQKQMIQAADRDYYFPVQGFIAVWPWEAMKMLVPLDAIGYHEDTRRSLKYFLALQSKLPPHGQIKSSDGVFGGTGLFEETGWERNIESTIFGGFYEFRVGKDFHNWINNTGSVLYAFGEHYFYSKDRKWLLSIAPALLKASNWIINERQQTKKLDAQGKKVLEYGLMPAGQPYDTTSFKEWAYAFCNTDGYTYQGLKRVAEALADAQHPEGKRLLKEAESYRQDILEVMRRTRQKDPKLPPYPERLYHPDGWGSYVTGPLSLVDTGLLDPHDPAFDQQEKYSRDNYNLLGFNGWLPATKGTRSSVYPVTTDDIYYHAWLERGEVEKALLSFYSVLAFAVDKQTLGSSERFSIDDQRFAPFYMNASTSSRMVGMIRSSVMLEKRAELRLLAGAPRRWLESGKTIIVQDATTYFGKLDMKVESQLDQQKILVELDLQKDRPERLKTITIRLPHPSKQSLKQVSVNGKPWKNYDATKGIIQIQPTVSRYQIVAQY